VIVTDRPILCAASVVQNIISGRQTQDRRPLSHPLAKVKVGDLLYVRESWQALSFGDYLPTKSHICDLRYAATDALADASKDVRGYPWRPSIHMPRWAIRLTLVVTEVRRQRVRDINDDDAIAEGVVHSRKLFDSDEGDVLIDWYSVPASEDPGSGMGATDAFSALWDSLYGHKPGLPWADNQEVCVFSFTAHRCNIDHFSDASKMGQEDAAE